MNHPCRLAKFLIVIRESNALRLILLKTLVNQFGAYISNRLKSKATGCFSRWMKRRKRHHRQFGYNGWWLNTGNSVF
jgi:hypothetical protein